ncbi:hypothetical protein M409DRAFT_49867 [Zasmidium cellare ATCC 36951]|uniref:Uncharacterized protein n=1 Tax=Zasmidium cellare ATCC 36951 TaxID=1080233 RepID=A0A6A6CYK7_ZASCE|nr:uncharacterized protein M409DRAFT_49867 [Zasmidium cellare ATCC 36951]KAF2172125.1 hypothetical protein M409DRAFT_49867 [Zasmidium cellare ATCC 36951]
MLSKSAFLAAILASLANAQTTYTGCHNETTSGTAIEYCYGPDGVESARATYASSLPATNAATTTAPAAGSAQTESVTGCHMHETAVYCINGAGSEVLVSATPTGEPPAAYTGCHSHGGEMFCVDPEGNDVALAAEAGTETEATGTSDEGQTTAVTGCHSHETDIYCINGAGAEVLVEATVTGEPPAQYTGCHSHGTEMYCLDPAGEEVFVSAEGEEEGSAASTGEPSENQHCHFHAGVEHCVGAGEEEGTRDCGLRTRDYNVGLRVGTLFVILVTSAIGVFLPLLLNKLPLGAWGGHILMVVKQFGTGVIISTGFVHLYTHAQLMFANECIGTLDYEATTSAIVMAGLFLSFLVEYLGLRLVASRAAKSAAESSAFQSQQETTKGSPAPSQESPRNAFAAVDHHHGGPNNKLSVMVMEAGILFHSILIGLTLVVSGDSFYRTLLVVIVFHQFFEGMALGARIAMLPGAIFPWKFVMAVAFTLITPIGMAIGIGVLNSFNGNDPSTVITFGTLDALSAGILIWVGLVDMWARDWVIEGGELLNSGLFKTLGGGAALIAGMVLMGVLGKWA